MKKILSAILAADMFGYSRLMENGEIDVITRQSQYLKDIIQPEILNRNGTLIKTTGDGFLAIFNTVQIYSNVVCCRSSSSNRHMCSRANVTSHAIIH